MFTKTIQNKCLITNHQNAQLTDKIVSLNHET